MRKQAKGFRIMDPTRQREIASQGGKKAHANKTAHQWTADEAREAGRKGGSVRKRRVASPDTRTAK